MSVRPIIRAGDPILGQVAAPVSDPKAGSVARLVADMLDTLDDIGGGGIAAPQIGVSLRVVIYFVPAHRCTTLPGDDPIDMTVLVNPEIAPVGEARYEDWDGCLSLPGLRGRTTRWERIRLVAHDLEVIAFVLHDARVADPTTLGFHDELVAAGRMPARVPVKPKAYARGTTGLLRRLEQLSAAN